MFSSLIPNKPKARIFLIKVAMFGYHNNGLNIIER